VTDENTETVESEGVKPFISEHHSKLVAEEVRIAINNSIRDIEDLNYAEIAMGLVLGGRMMDMQYDGGVADAMQITLTKGIPHHLIKYDAPTAPEGNGEATEQPEAEGVAA